MSHSHLTINHLLQQVEDYRNRRTRRDIRPQWVTDTIETTAELFEPLSVDEGRVGFECIPTEDGWYVAMYLGHTELIGGREDGRSLNPSFHVDLSSLIERFDPIESFRWIAVPESTVVDGRQTAGNSLVRIDGMIDGNRLILELHSVPPEDAGPGFHEFPNGQREAV